MKACERAKEYGEAEEKQEDEAMGRIDLRHAVSTRSSTERIWRFMRSSGCPALSLFLPLHLALLLPRRRSKDQRWHRYREAFMIM